jgi:uncharacterized protein (UPF0335 family)
MKKKARAKSTKHMDVAQDKKLISKMIKKSEKKDVTNSQKELMAEAKGRGYDTKVMKKIIAIRKRKADAIAEEEAVLEMYKAALGMA